MHPVLITAALLPSVAATIPVATSSAPIDYWPKCPRPAVIRVIADWNTFPSLAAGVDPGGSSGALAFAMESLAGLVALAEREGRSRDLIWLGLGPNAAYDAWLATVIRVTHARRVPAPDPMALVAEYARRRIVRGYILYRADRSKRDAYSASPETCAGYTNSVNAATGLAAILGAVLVEESAETAFQKLGLRRLADVRDRTEEWFFEHYRDRCSRTIVHVIDPKVIHNRSYAIATRSICLFGTTRVTDRIFRWLAPNTPVVGWNGGDEYRQTSQMSRWAKFNTASNWCMNLPVLSAVIAGRDVPWRALQVNRRSRIEPLNLGWESNRHYTSFVLSDGDNLQWMMGNFTHHPSYWATRGRGAIPFGWTSPLACAAQIAVPTLAYLAATATANDTVIMTEAGGYIYHDEYAKEYANANAVLDAHVDQVAGRMQRLGANVLELLAAHAWDSVEARKACGRIARRIPGLDGILVIQYYPYNGGHGEVFWVRNREGETIPVISARYALWAHARSIPANGPPAYVASLINKAAFEGPVTSVAFMDWTIVHAWSVFKRSGDPADLAGEEVNVESAKDREGAAGGYEPVQWAVERLAPHVRVVSPTELIWRMRLHLRTRETLDALAVRRLRAAGRTPRASSELARYRRWLASAPLTSDDQRRGAYNRLRDLTGH